MVRNTCPYCGTVTDDLSQKFCTQCGTKLPDLPVATIRTRGIPLLAGVGIVVILILVIILWSPIAPMISGTSSAGLTGTRSTDPTSLSVEITPLSPTLPAPTGAIPQDIVTTVPTPVFTLVSTTITPTTTRVTSAPATTVTTVATIPPTPEFTSQITLSVTHIPVQPPADTVTSKTPGAPYLDPSILEARIHELINVQRQQNGLLTLSYDSFLSDIARGHSYDMTLRNFFEHENPDGKNARARGDAAGYPCVRDFGTYFTSGISENLYQGYRYQTYLTAPNGTIMSYNWSSVEFIANQAVNGWMNSEGHRENILDYHFRQEGIGVSFSSDDKIYVTENFC